MKNKGSLREWDLGEPEDLRKQGGPRRLRGIFSKLGLEGKGLQTLFLNLK